MALKNVQVGIGEGKPNFDINVAGVKALEWDIYNLKDWVENAIQVRVSMECNLLILVNTDKNPHKMSYSAKLTEISSIDNGYTGYTTTIIIDLDSFDLGVNETKALKMSEAELKTLIEEILDIKRKSCIDIIAKDETTDRLETLSDLEKETLVTNSTIQSAYDRMNP